jgi:hypothetical protein
LAQSGISPRIDTQGQAEVLVHVYDLGTSAVTQFLNSYAQNMGIFHSGVEVYGAEWCFGSTNSGTGVSKIVPCTANPHIYRKTVSMGCTKLTMAQVRKVVELLTEKWPGDSYHILSRNCIHFSNAFCELLGCGPLPAWIFGIVQRTKEAEELVLTCHRDIAAQRCCSVVLGDHPAPLPPQLKIETDFPSIDSCFRSCSVIPMGLVHNTIPFGKENRWYAQADHISASIPTSPETMSEAVIMGKIEREDACASRSLSSSDDEDGGRGGGASHHMVPKAPASTRAFKMVRGGSARDGFLESFAGDSDIDEVPHVATSLLWKELPNVDDHLNCGSVLHQFLPKSGLGRERPGVMLHTDGTGSWRRAQHPNSPLGLDMSTWSV